MRKSKFLALAVSLAGAIMFAPSSQATIAPTIVAGGSSGAFTSVVIAMTQGDANTGFTSCGNFVWTAGTGLTYTAFAHDPRNAAIPDEPGNIAVVWDHDLSVADGGVLPTKVCIYLSVDTIVGQRFFFARDAAGNPNVTIHLPAAAKAAGAVGKNKVAFITDTCQGGPGCAFLPPEVWDVIDQGGTGIAGTGSLLNVAFTDLRPEDAQYGYVRASCTPANEDGCLGYGGTGVIGFPIESSFDTGSVANVIPYTIQGADPFTNGPAPAFTTVPFAADPVVVFVSQADNTANGGLKWLTTPGNSPYLTNVPSKTLAAIFAGKLGQTQDLAGTSLGSSEPLYVVQREPLSGTYNTFEFQVPHSRDGNSSLSQETGFTPTGSAAGFNPVFSGTNVVPPGPACSWTPIASAPPFNQPPAGAAAYCANPMNVPSPEGASFSRRYRAVGTGDLVGAVAGMVMTAGNLNDSIGYAFFGLGTFKSKALKYLTVDGSDPLYNGYSVADGGIAGDFSATSFCGGSFIPAPSTFHCHNAGDAPPTFAGLLAGNYRIWSLIRATVLSSYVEPGVNGVYHLIQAAQDQLSTIPDMVPFQVCPAGCVFTVATNTWSANVTLPIFRSHYGFSPAPNNVYGMPNGVTANNGTNSSAACGGPQEAGGDMAGTIFYRINDVDFCGTRSAELQTWIQ